MKTRFLAASASALAAAALFFGGLCSPAQAADPYEIHVILSLSGPGAFLGNGERQALQFAESATNASGGIQGHKLTFVYHDDQTNPQVAVQLANDVLATKPAVILGSSLVATCRAMMPLMQNGPLMYCFSPGIHPDEGSYVFTASVSTFDLADSVIRYFRMKGWKRFGVIFSTDASGQDAEKGHRRAAAEAGEHRDPGGGARAFQHHRCQRLGADREDQGGQSAGHHRLEHGCADRNDFPRDAASRARYPDRHHRRQHDLCPDDAI
jgi:ABC-type branched-subunit amino acid transport system substrate-binding protein